MRDYEVVYIFRPELESEEVDDRLESYHDRLDGEVTALEHWGQRELAYEIEEERRGYYAVAHLRADPASLEELEQALDLDEDLIRYLLVVSEGELAVPPSQRHEEEEEDEADEEESEEESEEEEEEDEDEEEDEAEDEEAEEDEDAEDEEEDEGASPDEDDEADEDGEGAEEERDEGDEPDDEGDADDETADETDDEER